MGLVMSELSDNEAAVLQLIVAKPLTVYPPHVCAISESLARRGLAVFEHGAWFATAQGICLTHHTIH